MEKPKTLEEALLLIDSLEEKTNNLEKLENDNNELKKRNIELYKMLMAKPIQQNMSKEEEEVKPCSFEEILNKVKKGEIKQ